VSSPRPFRIGASGVVGDRYGSAGPNVVLLHAGVCDRRSWSRVSETLSMRATVIAYDRRGFGDSPPASDPFSHVEDLVALLDETTQGPLWLVGSSMGGGLALDAALGHPFRVAGLVLLAPGVRGAPDVEVDELTMGLIDAIEAAEDREDLEEVNRLETSLWLDGPAGPPGRVNGPARDLALAMNRIVLTNGISSDAGESDIDTWSRLGEVAVPTTIACGALDLPECLAVCEGLGERLPGARRVTLPSVAHLPYLEDPGMIADLIESAVFGAGSDDPH